MKCRRSTEKADKYWHYWVDSYEIDQWRMVRPNPYGPPFWRLPVLYGRADYLSQNQYFDPFLVQHPVVLPVLGFFFIRHGPNNAYEVFYPTQGTTTLADSLIPWNQPIPRLVELPYTSPADPTRTLTGFTLYEKFNKICWRIDVTHELPAWLNDGHPITVRWTMDSRTAYSPRVNFDTLAAEGQVAGPAVPIEQSPAQLNPAYPTCYVASGLGTVGPFYD